MNVSSKAICPLSLPKDSAEDSNTEPLKKPGWSDVPFPLQRRIAWKTDPSSRAAMRRVNKSMRLAAESVIYGLHVSAMGVTTLSKACAYPAVNTLICHNVNGKTLSSIPKTILSLALRESSNTLSDTLALRNLRHLPLISLDLHSCAAVVNEFSLLHLRNMPLRLLNLSYTHVGDAGAFVIAKITSITSLWLKQCGIGALGAKALAKHKELETLYLSDNTIGSSAARSLADNQTVTCLSLARCASIETPFDPTIWETFAENRALTMLDIRDNALDPNAAGMLAQSKTIKILRLDKNAISELSFRAIADNTVLRALSLANCQIQPVDIALLARNSRIKELNLSSNCLSARALKTLSKNKAIKMLSLVDTEMDDKGLRRIWRMRQLRSLWVDHNRITSLGTARLAMHPALHELGIMRNEMGPASVAALVRMGFPRLFLDIADRPGHTLYLHNVEQLIALRETANFKEIGSLQLSGPSFHNQHLALLPDALNSLFLTGCTAVTPAGYAYLAAYPLQRLSLSSMQVGNEGTATLASLRTLLALKLQECGLDDHDAKTLSASTTLTMLELEKNPIGVKGLVALARRATNLKLYVERSRIAGLDENGRVYVHRRDFYDFPQGKGRFYSERPEPLAEAPLLLNAQTVLDKPLGVGNQAFIRPLADDVMCGTARDFEELQRHPAFDELKSLALLNNEFHGGHLRALPPSLTSLSLLACSRLDADDLAYLAQRPITSLSLVDMALDDDTLAAFVTASRLQNLSMSSMKIGPKTARTIAVHPSLGRVGIRGVSLSADIRKILNESRVALYWSRTP